MNAKPKKCISISPFRRNPPSVCVLSMLTNCIPHQYVRWIEFNVRIRIMQSKTKAQLVFAIEQQGVITIEGAQRLR